MWIRNCAKEHQHHQCEREKFLGISVSAFPLLLTTIERSVLQKRIVAKRLRTVESRHLTLVNIAQEEDEEELLWMMDDGQGMKRERLKSSDLSSTNPQNLMSQFSYEPSASLMAMQRNIPRVSPIIVTCYQQQSIQQLMAFLDIFV